MPTDLDPAPARYAALIESMLSGPADFDPGCEDAASIQVKRGAALAIAIRYPNATRQIQTHLHRVKELASEGGQSALRVVDAAGHSRPVYRPLLAYAWFQTCRVLGVDFAAAEWVGSRPALERVVGGINIEWPDPAGLEHRLVPAARGAEVGAAAWSALARALGADLLQDGSTARYRAEAAELFRLLATAQTPAGAWLTTARADNPETHWFHELVILHAAADYAVQFGDGVVLAAVGRNARYHLEETQPDHATNEPWALAAFCLNPATHPLADGLLHAAAVHGGGMARGLTSLLLADALYCLRRAGRGTAPAIDP